MSNTIESGIGSVVSLWRYPVKSMLGEELRLARVMDHGLVGDRAYALVDNTDGKVATAKNPRKWPNLFAFRATLLAPSASSAEVGPVRITLPDGATVTSEQGDCNEILSKTLQRRVTLAPTKRGSEAQAEEYWPDMEGLDHRDTVTDFALPPGTYFDCAAILLLTTTTLNRLQELYPQGRFDVQRFRPNIVVAPMAAAPGFVENAWIGQTITIGDEVRLRVTGPCGRCVMTTLTQETLPKDSEILRTAVQHNQGQVGVYAAVERGGTIRLEDQVRLAA